MEWTQKTPTKPGVYWILDEHHTCSLDIGRLFYDSFGKLKIMRFGSHSFDDPAIGDYYLPVELPTSLPVEGTPEEAFVYAQ